MTRDLNLVQISRTRSRTCKVRLHGLHEAVRIVGTNDDVVDHGGNEHAIRMIGSMSAQVVVLVTPQDCVAPMGKHSKQKSSCSAPSQWIGMAERTTW